ncbi:MAG: S41 family peptidase [Pseudomonadota bacterium]
MRDRNSIFAAILFMGGTALTACSGGDGGSAAAAAPAPVATTAPPPAATSSGPTFAPGIFEDSDQFQAQCEAPRSGVDIEGNAFPDQAGSTVLENFWLRSWTNETYLWPDEVPDQNPALFDSRLTYFAELRSREVTPSGEDQDDFHFSEPTESFLERRNSAPTGGYGADFVILSPSPPRDVRVRYTEENTPASQAPLGIPNLVRGTRILEVDGIDLVNGAGTDVQLDALNAGLFPATIGETHTFVVQDPGAADPRSITLSSASVVPDPVNRVQTIDTPTGEVGYILFNTFSPFASEEEIATAMRTLSNADVEDLVLDLRYNGGGLLAVASQLSFMIAGPNATRNRTFETLRFNDAAGNNNPVTGEFNAPIPFHDSGLGFSLVTGEDLPSLSLPRVFILSTEDTCSASEADINGLRGIGVEVILIGDTTCGKPFGFYPTDNCGETYYTIQFQGLNDVGFGDYTDGFVPANSTFPFGVRTPGCVVPDTFDAELGDPTEALLAAALQFREDGTCPAQIASSSKSAIDQGSTKSITGLALYAPPEDILSTNRDMQMPF